LSLAIVLFLDATTNHPPLSLTQQQYYADGSKGKDEIKTFWLFGSCGVTNILDYEQLTTGTQPATQ
jgi:hypothetical protein